MKPATRSGRYARYALMLGAVAALAVVLGNMAAYSARAGLDLTPNGRFTVSEGARSILSRFSKPINVTYYVSRNRPTSRGSLERDISSRLANLAEAVGQERFNFDGERDIVRIDDGGVALREMTELGVKQVTESIGAQSVSYYSAVRMTYIDSLRPIVIQDVRSPATLEYEIVSRAVRLLALRPCPPSAMDKFRGLRHPVKLIYVHGMQDDGDGALPPERAGLIEAVESVLKRIRDVAPERISWASEAAVTSEFRNRCEPTASDVISTPDRPSALRPYYSSVIVSSERGEAPPADRITKPDGLFELLAQLAWDAEKPRERVGVLVSDVRVEASDAEIGIFYNYQKLGRSPEYDVIELIKLLDYEAVPVRISPEHMIPGDLGALVIPRPSGLSDRQRYEIEQYLARGGRILLFHGEWHVSLADRGLRPNPDTSRPKELWAGGVQVQTLPARAIPGTLAPTLKKYGVTSEPGILLSERRSLPYRIYVPGIPASREDNPDPVTANGKLGLTPVAVQAMPRHMLAGDVPALPVRGASPLRLDMEVLRRLGLDLETVFAAPQDARLLKLSGDGEAAIAYKADIAEGVRGILPYVKKPAFDTLEDVGGRALGVVLKGRFPFDPKAPAPPFRSGDRSIALGAGTAFIQGDGTLVVIAAPDLFEKNDYAGWCPGEAPLLGGADRLPDVSRRRLLANVLDSLVFGEDMIRVRSALLPPPRRVEEWSGQEIRFWSMMNVGLVPFAVAFAGVLCAGYVRRRRVRHERNAQGGSLPVVQGQAASAKNESKGGK